MSLTKRVFQIAAIFCVALPIHAQTLDATLTITNKTDFDSTSIINNGGCSAKLGPNGITRAHSTNVVPDKIVRLSCLRSPNNCTAVVYLTTNCSGAPIYTVVFDVDKGIKSANPIDPEHNNFQISYSGFSITLYKK